MERASNRIALRLVRIAEGLCVGLVGLGLVGEIIGRAQSSAPEAVVSTPYVVFATNDLGMHCMGQDFSELMILPPYNTLHAQVIRRGHSPEIIHENEFTVSYVMPANTRGADKTNFWENVQQLMGVSLPPGIGLTGKGLKGTMEVTPNGDWEAAGIPVVPVDDDGRENPYPLANVTVTRNGSIVAQTQAVVPVSWEMSCFACHNSPGESFGVDILKDHDRLHGTTLVSQQPVFCGSCHSDNALGTPGTPGVPSLSSAMHLAHAERMGGISMDVDCYACHPGERTQCQRDVHFSKGMTCHDCHGDMAAVGDPSRTPWLDQPSCGDCHQRAGFEFEEPGKLFRQSRGHMGVTCLACHGSPHAITPTSTDVDNIQATTIQGHAGVIDNCNVCHIQTPEDSFPHRRNDD